MKSYNLHSFPKLLRSLCVLFQMVILSDCLNIKFNLFAIQNSYLKFAVLCACVCLLLLYICFSKRFGTIFWGHSDCHNISQERAFSLCCQFWSFKFRFVWVVTFLFLKSEFFICNNCTFIFLYPLTPEFSFSPPSPPPLLHSQLNHIIRNGALMKRSG